jgi:hypothetical protein
MRVRKYEGKKEAFSSSEFTKIKIVFKNFNQESVSFLSSELLGDSKVLIELFTKSKIYSEKMKAEKEIILKD